ncbi:MAG: hypothetical protein ACFFCI_00690 [Promethearchaeota archaeon]
MIKIKCAGCGKGLEKGAMYPLHPRADGSIPYAHKGCATPDCFAHEVK